MLSFTVVRVLPGDPALLIMGTEGNPAATARLRGALGLDRPIPLPYLDWFWRALRGDLGVSIQVRRAGGPPDPESAPGDRAPYAPGRPLFVVAAAVPLGLYAATHHRRAGDYVTMIVSQFGIAIPSFWTGLLLILLFSVHLGWVRSGGFGGWSRGIVAGLRSLLLPALALGFFQAAVLVRATRSAVLDVLREDYVSTARAKGVAEARVIAAHALPNALIPILTVAGVQLGQLLAGSIILESVFALPGLGRLALGAISARDLPVVQGVALFVAASIVLINFTVDLAYVLLDPRIRAD
jgi:peptide/nickel transport system permease protein